MSIKYIRGLYYCVSIVLLMPTGMCSWYFNYKPSTVNVTSADIQEQSPLVTLLLVPAGDARNQGRSLEHQFESSSAHAYARSLKTAIEKINPVVRVLVSHKPGEIVQPFQVPTMANTLAVDLVITINCYRELGPKPALYLYQFSYGAEFISKLSECAWNSIDNAYLFAKATTGLWAAAFVNACKSDDYTSIFTVHGPYKLPFKPLIGIKVPALGLEMSILQDDDWTTLINPIVAACEQLFNPIIKQRSQMEVV